MSGSFYGVGVGPGDPELLTVKAVRLIESADVIAYHAGTGKSSNARRIAAHLIPEGVTEEELRYPVTTNATNHPGGYEGALADFYRESAQRLGEHLRAGRSVVLLSEGDPLFYGSFMYMHDRLAQEFETEIVPGVPAFAAAAATTASPLVRQTDVLTVLPGTLPEPELARRLADTDGAIVMKLGRTFPAVRRALAASGRLEHALYVERASMDEERWLPVSEVDPDTVPYFSLIVVPGDSQNGLRTRSGRSSSEPQGERTLVGRSSSEPQGERTLVGRSSSEPPGERLSRPPQPLYVVGLGPGPDKWLSPEASTVLAEVSHVVGYGPYVNRVPQRDGLVRHASGNTVEVDRATFALDLALQGEKVAVVSGGDAGVFGMAAAVYEAAEDPAYASVPVRVVPGISAIQAVAARAGAPVGADFCVMSLSDRLKPWAVIEQRLRAAAEADLVIGLYNPASRSRTEQVGLAQKVLLSVKPDDTVVVVGRDVGRAEESLLITTLGELDPSSIDMKCLLLIGADSTRVTDSGAVWTPRWVET